MPKAAVAAPNERPKTTEHFESLELIAPLDLPASVTLVDDIITRGAQLLGAAWRVWSVRPDIAVRGFAVMRTISKASDFSVIRAPDSSPCGVASAIALRNKQGPPTFP